MKKDKSDLNNERSDQEELSQQALGNEAADAKPDNNNDLLSTPKTSGTGSNNPSSTPHSLIVHEDKEGDEKYEQGETKTD